MIGPLPQNVCGKFLIPVVIYVVLACTTGVPHKYHRSTTWHLCKGSPIFQGWTSIHPTACFLNLYIHALHIMNFLSCQNYLGGGGQNDMFAIPIFSLGRLPPPPPGSTLLIWSTNKIMKIWHVEMRQFSSLAYNKKTYIDYFADVLWGVYYLVPYHE